MGLLSVELCANELRGYNMPIGVISREDMELELSSDRSVLHLVPNAKHGRNVGDDNVPQSVREFIAQESILGASAKELHEALGVSRSSISAYKNGATSTDSYNRPQDKLKSVVESIKDKIGSSAQNKIEMALELIDKDKLERLGVRDLGGFAKDMAHVVEKMQPKDSAGDNNHVHLHLHAPEQRKLETYEVHEVEVE